MTGAANSAMQAASLAEKLDQRREAELKEEAQALAKLEEAAKRAPRRQEVVKVQTRMTRCVSTIAFVAHVRGKLLILPLWV